MTARSIADINTATPNATGSASTAIDSVAALRQLPLGTPTRPVSSHAARRRSDLLVRSSDHATRAPTTQTAAMAMGMSSEKQSRTAPSVAVAEVLRLQPLGLTPERARW